MSRPRHPLIATVDDVPPRPPLVITIPLEGGNLPKALSPNHRSRTHWPKTRAIADARQEAYLETRAAEPTITSDRLTLHVVIARTGRAQALDDDNAWASLKAYRDGIADALGMDDRDIRQGTLQQVKSETGKAYLRIAIEAASDTEREAA